MEGLATLPLFLTTAESGSFAGAGRRLGLSASAIGKAIARLEHRLGVTLFHRTTRRIALTAEGQLLLERARLIRDDWSETEALLAEAKSEPSGRLRISLPAIGYRFLAPHVQAFTRLYPKITLDLDFDDRIVDLVAEKVDVAIRSGSLDDSIHRSRRLGYFRFILCASTSYLERCPKPTTIASLRRHALIRFRHSGTERLQPWRLGSNDDAVGDKSTVSCTNMEGVLSATLEGMGIAQMPDFLATTHVASGKIVVVLEKFAVSDTFWLVWPNSAYRSPKLRAFIEFSVGRLLPQTR